MLQEQFDELKDQESNSLMRANTPASRMMTTYTRRGPGQSYLKQALAGVINRTIQGNDNLELNPIKVGVVPFFFLPLWCLAHPPPLHRQVYEQMINDIETETGKCDLPRTVTMEEAEANPRVQELIRPRILRLRDLSEMFVNELIGSKDKVPYGIRWICKQIRQLAKVRRQTKKKRVWNRLAHPMLSLSSGALTPRTRRWRVWSAAFLCCGS